MCKTTGSLTAEENQDSEPPSSCTSNLSKQSLQTSTIPISSYDSDNWNDWKWQIKNRIRSVEQLLDFLPFALDEAELRKVIQKYPMAITPYYASLIRQSDISDPI